MAKPRKKSPVKPTFDARPDTLDFRDRMFVPTLVEVPTHIDLAGYKKAGVPILNQGNEGSCTGFGLATVVHYLLRSRAVVPDRTAVSPRMLYEMARRYDEWAGTDYQGSSARGAMKGWHKHGVCSEAVWPYQPGNPDPRLTDERAQNAGRRPLGAYFRVNHKDLVAMHAALVEAGILYATGTVHDGWLRPEKGVIRPGSKELGGHAFAIVAYDDRGFWIQNSFGKSWGQSGFALLPYDDWLDNGTDVWAARLAVPLALETRRARARARIAYQAAAEGLQYAELRPHIVSVGNDGWFRSGGTYGSSPAEVESIFANDFPRITRSWSKKRLLLYAHGGLVNEKSAIQRVADYRPSLIAAEVYPLAFVWRTDYWTTLSNMLRDAIARRRPEGILDATKDFMLDRLDDALEPLAQALTGKSQWKEMKENAELATSGAEGAARFVAGQLAKMEPQPEIHLAAHSAGSILLALLAKLLSSQGQISDGPLAGDAGLGLKIATCTLWAPAMTMELFKQTYLGLINSNAIRRFALFTLTDRAEQDDNCANIYHKSLLYLVSNAFEQKPRIPLFRDGEPILGMEKFVKNDKELARLFKANKKAAWILAPNQEPEGSPNASRARHHGDFDDDSATVKATLARILGAARSEAAFSFDPSASHLRDQRLRLS